MTDALDCEAVCVSKSLAVMTTGEILQVTDWFDSEGDECPPCEAVACIAGPDIEGRWYSISLSDFQNITIQ
jgi:hypothetical protein